MIEHKRIKINNYENTKSLPELWHASYYNELYRYGFGKIIDKDLLMDLIQETFLIALESINKFDGRSSEKTWMTGILKNRIFVSYRKQKARRALFVEVDNWALLEQASSLTSMKMTQIEDPNDVFDKEYRRIVHHGITRLPLLWRSIYIMKVLEDQPAHVIRKELRLSSSNYWVICHRAKDNLKTYVANEHKKKTMEFR